MDSIDSAETCGRTILVVEDEAMIRMMLVDELEDAGFEVIEAENAEVAILSLGRYDRIRAVITDVRMPGSIDGLGLARAVSVRLESTGVVGAFEL